LTGQSARGSNAAPQLSASLRKKTGLRKGRALRALAMAGAAVLLPLACGGPQELLDAGATCFRSDDCKAGLACVPASPGASRRVCSSDLTGVVSEVDGAVVDEDGGPPPVDAGNSDAGSDARVSSDAAGDADAADAGPD
jgi:hypothetical protein